MKDILYIQKLRSLLQQEYESDKEDFRQQLEVMGLEKRKRRGLCWCPVKFGNSYYNSINQLVLEVFKTEDDEVEHSFEYGKPVVFFHIPEKDMFAYADAKKKSKATSKQGIKDWIFGSPCQISYVEEGKMVVVLSSTKMVTELVNHVGEVGVQLYFDETSYKTMFHALDEVINDKGGRLSVLRSIFSGITLPQKRTLPPLTIPGLNRSQARAVNEVMCAKDVAVVHGPPGTGKTTTLVEAIFETLKKETQVLVCAQSNTAVDWIGEKLVDHGLSVLRIGNPTRVNDKMLSFTYEQKFEAHPSYPDLWKIRQTIRSLKNKRSYETHQKLARLRERADELEFTIREELFQEARVICCTLVGADNRILFGQKYHTLFIDEAAQAMEPACWIAMRRAHRVVLAGDHRQLPPTIKCFDAMKGGLGVTLMERIVEKCPQCVTMLNIQYRMHEQIMKFSSHWFYDDGVIAAPSVKNRSILEYDYPITWVEAAPEENKNIDVVENLDNLDSIDNSAFREEFVGETHSRINKDEAHLTIKTLEDYLTRIRTEKLLAEHLSIGIISPYRQQIIYLKSLVKQSQALKPFRKSISVNTIDGFQGQERDIIMISLVRSNEKGEIGFLRDLRRMNVAMTRARTKLIILGNKETLSHNPFYRDLINYIEEIQKNNEFEIEEKISADLPDDTELPDDELLAEQPTSEQPEIEQPVLNNEDTTGSVEAHGGEEHPEGRTPLLH